MKNAFHSRHSEKKNARRGSCLTAVLHALGVMCLKKRPTGRSRCLTVAQSFAHNSAKLHYVYSLKAATAKKVEIASLRMVQMRCEIDLTWRRRPYARNGSTERVLIRSAADLHMANVNYGSRRPSKDIDLARMKPRWRNFHPQC